MGCLPILLAIISPRLALAALWIFTLQVSEAFDSVWVPVLGFVFLPWATFIYALLWAPGGLYAFAWVLVAFGVVADISSWGESGRRRQPERR